MDDKKMSMEGKNANRLAGWLVLLIFAAALVPLFVLAGSVAEVALQLLVWAYVFGLALFFLHVARHPDPGIMTVKWDADNKRQRQLASRMSDAVAVAAAFTELAVSVAWHAASAVVALMLIMAAVVVLVAVLVVYTWKIKNAV